MRKYVPITPNSNRRGFTLLELTMVLLIVAIVLGALWAAATHVWDNYRAERAAQQVTKVVQNIRDYYMNAQSLSAASGTDITASLDQLNLFPTEMRRNPGAAPGNSPIDHQFNNDGVAFPNGSLRVLSEKCPNGTTQLATPTCFRIGMQGLEPGDCIRLLDAVPVTDADLGILGVGTQNPAALQDRATTPAGLTGVPAAVTPSGAAAWCNLNGATNEVDWDFKLHN